LELYLLRRLVGALVFACGGMALVAIPCVLVAAVHKVAGVGMAAVLGYVPILLLELAPYLVPIGFLLAVVSTYGRLAADNEWTAALLALALSAGLYLVETRLSPSLNYQKRSYGKNSAMQLLKSLNPGRTELRFGEFYLSAAERDPDDRNVFRQVFLHLPPSEGRPAQTIYAQEVQISVDGSILSVDLRVPRWADERYDMRVGRLQVKMDLDQAFGTQGKDREHWRFQDSSELAARIERSEALLATSDGAANLAELGHADRVVPPKDLRAAVYVLHSREALALICPMFLLLGVPTGLFLRRGSQLAALAVAIGYALVYYIVSMRLGKVLANNEVVPVWFAALGTSIVGSLSGLVLLARAVRS
jgi:lipopolysaccharide export LptBFGC system permease protein LptF